MNNRRKFLKTIGLGGAVAAVGGLAAVSCKPVTQPEKKSQVTLPGNLSLNLCLQEGVAPGETLVEKLDFMEANGVHGFEVWGGKLGARVAEIQKALQNRKIKMTAICAGFDGWLIASEEKDRKKCMETTKEILVSAGALGSYGMILVPGFNGQKPSLPFVEARAMLVDELKELGEFAAKNNTSIILEPLNRKEAWFMRLVADAAAICRDVNSPGITCMGDFWHMTAEETNDMAAFLSAGKYLNHVHIASRKTRNTPGEDEGDNYENGFKGLKMVNYQHYVSFECGTKGDKKVAIPAAIKLLNEQWNLA
jgi:sugar phosphate isomerase/epimerase